jgi:hypothetical protein
MAGDVPSVTFSPPRAVISFFVGLLFRHRCRVRTSSQFALIALLAGVAMFVPAQTAARGAASKPAAEAPAAITKVRVLLSQGGPPALEVSATRAVTPQIQKVQNPDRIVIDLPNTVMSVRSKKIDVKSDQVSAIRLDQFQDRPPTVRIVIDLLKPSEYSSNAVGNVLTVHLNQPAAAQQTPQAPTVPAFTQGVRPAIVPVSPGSNGAIIMAGSRLADGSSVSAGATTAVLKLTRGGEVRLCPGTTVSVTQSKNQRDVMLGMNTGAIETHYTSGQSADAILTPDFRILLAGPGDFQYAVSVDSRGNTCVRTLPGNTAPVIVSELMGDGSYQVKPSEQIMFHAGKLTNPGTDIPASCGCPAPPIPELRAANPSAPQVDESKMPANMRLARPEDEGKPIEVPTANAGTQSAAATPPSQVTMSVSSETAPLPPTGSNDVHVKVEVPFVFRGDATPAPPPAPVTEAKQLPVADMQRPEPPAPTVTPAPPPKKPAERHGVMGKIKGFFSSVFH